MKVKNLTKVLFLLLLLMGTVPAVAQFGNVKNKINNVKNNNKKEDDKKEENGSSDDNSKSNSTAGLSCGELAEKGDLLYEDGKYKEAWEYYEQIEKDGCVSQLDGSSRINMNNCRKQVEQASNTSGSAGIIAELAPGAYFSAGWGNTEFKESFSLSEDVFVKFKMAKTMMEYSADFGIDEMHTAYGFFRIYFDGKEAAKVGPFNFSSNYSKVWTDFDLPLYFPLDFVKDVQTYANEHPEVVSTSQGIWALQELGAPSVQPAYVSGAITNIAGTNGAHKVKIEFCLGIRDTKEIKGTIASGEFVVNVDDAGKAELYKRGPKNMRPLDDNEKGKFDFSSYSAGSGALTAKLSLPHPVKYYNEKWCKSMSCDYDHGDISFYAELDGEQLSSWNTTLWEDDYQVKTDFDFTVFPSNDAQISDQHSTLNSELIFGKDFDNRFAFAFFDLLYSGKLKAGEHSITIKAYSSETVPLNETYENSKAFHSKWPAIAISTFKFNISADAITKITAASTGKKPKHAGGEWTAVDAHLLKTPVSDGHALIDVAVQTDWAVTVNAFGTPLYRVCSADIVYKTSQGEYRYAEGISVKEDYEGGGYSKPYFTDNLYLLFTAGPGELDNFNYPVPPAKVK